ncbi:MAG: sensor histidine kinase [Planctomycetota bacterium]|jgi:signal transduction histidine kinase
MTTVNENSDLLHAVTERVKELTCLYEVSKLLADPGKSLEDIFDETVKLIPSAWQYPDTTCARIIFDDKEYSTPDFQQTEWILSSDITIQNEKRGKIDVVYVEEKPALVEGPFLKEERHLIDALAREMRAIIKRKQAEVERSQYLHEATERVKELTCLYRIAQVSENEEYSLDRKLQKITELLPPAWQYPDITCARISVDGKFFLSERYLETTWNQKAEIYSGGEHRGFVEVAYTAKKPELDEGPFLKQERALINNVAREIAFIIEKTELDDERAKLREQLIHADRLATIGQLAAGVAHELNEPLSNILGFAQLIDENDDLQEQVQNDIGVIIKASLHAREVIKKLMLFAKKMPPVKAPINLNQVIREGLYFLEARCAKGNIELIQKLPPDLPEIIADPAQITQVIVNIVVNAIQAMPDGGKLVVTTSLNDDEVLLVVEDTGIGIDEDILEQIFLPFFTTKEPDKGTGLGLSVVHGIVEAHGGEIKVSSEVGSGTRFAIKLPV